MASPKKKRLVLSYLAIVLFTGLVTGFLVNSIISNRVIVETQERVKEALNAARWVYTARVNDLDRVIRLTAIRHVVISALKENKPHPLMGEMSNLMLEEGLDFLTFVDRKGTVLFRFHNPGVLGDSMSDDPFFRDAIGRRGTSGTQMLSREVLLKDGNYIARRAAFGVIPTPRETPTDRLEETSGMVIKAAHPVIETNGNVVGVLMGGILLNRNYEIVDRIKSIVFRNAKYEGKEIGTATIFLGDLRVSTNVFDREGNRAVGTRLMKEVGDQVLQKGLTWTHRAYVVDDWYITAYEPIRDIQDKIIGVLYVGILESKYVQLKDHLLVLFMVGLLIAVILTLLISSRYLCSPSETPP
jgi:two-component system, NtrC family, sensor kinase